MLLSELDGFLTAIVLGAATIAPGEWMQSVWGTDGGDVAPFEDPADVRWFADAVLARRDEIARDLARGKPQPIFDVDERNGELLWESWVAGFEEAMALRPDDWAAIAAAEGTEGSAAVSRMSLLISIAHDESGLDGIAINAAHDRAPADIIDCVRCLYAARAAAGDMATAATPTARVVKIGRNDPCACGSGRKSKRCCG